MTGLVEGGVLAGGDGRHERARAAADRPSAMGRDLEYRLTDAGARRLRDLGVDVDGALARPRAPIRYCVDWSEQAHHLSGRSRRGCSSSVGGAAAAHACGAAHRRRRAGLAQQFGLAAV